MNVKYLTPPQNLEDYRCGTVVVGGETFGLVEDETSTAATSSTTTAAGRSLSLIRSSRLAKSSNLSVAPSRASSAESTSSKRAKFKRSLSMQLMGKASAAWGRQSAANKEEEEQKKQQAGRQCREIRMETDTEDFDCGLEDTMYSVRFSSLSISGLDPLLENQKVYLSCLLGKDARKTRKCVVSQGTVSWPADELDLSVRLHPDSGRKGLFECETCFWTLKRRLRKRERNSNASGVVGRGVLEIDPLALRPGQAVQILLRCGQQTCVLHCTPARCKCFFSDQVSQARASSSPEHVAQGLHAAKKRSESPRVGYNSNQ